MTKLEAWAAWAEKAMGGNQDPMFTLEKSSLGNAFSCGYDAGMEAARESDRHADADALLALLKRCRPIIEADAQMMADISRHAPLDADSQAKHDATEYESEKLARELERLLGPNDQLGPTLPERDTA